jgi:hypothetical protein
MLIPCMRPETVLLLEFTCYLGFHLRKFINIMNEDSDKLLNLLFNYPNLLF